MPGLVEPLQNSNLYGGEFCFPFSAIHPPGLNFTGLKRAQPWTSMNFIEWPGACTDVLGWRNPQKWLGDAAPLWWFHVGCMEKICMWGDGFKVVHAWALLSLCKIQTCRVGSFASVFRHPSFRFEFDRARKKPSMDEIGFYRMAGCLHAPELYGRCCATVVVSWRMHGKNWLNIARNL